MEAYIASSFSPTNAKKNLGLLALALKLSKIGREPPASTDAIQLLTFTLFISLPGIKPNLFFILLKISIYQTNVLTFLAVILLVPLGVFSMTFITTILLLISHLFSVQMVK